MIYNNFLSDSKNAILMSQEDDIFTPKNIDGKNEQLKVPPNAANQEFEIP